MDVVSLPNMLVDRAVEERQRTAKLKDGAEQFEAMMLGQMLKDVKFGGAPGSDDEGSNGTMGQYGVEVMAKAIASGGGFGLARQIVRQVQSEAQKTARA